MPNVSMMIGVAAVAPSPSKTITIDHTKVGLTDSTNFTVTIKETLAYLKTVGNGGSVTNANGYDIGFYSDALLTTKLKWETELYTPTTGQVVYHVKVPTISHTVDTVIYWGYGNAAITTDQSDAVNAWDANTKRVYHLGDGSSLTGVDSVGIGNATITSATAAAGDINGAAHFTAANQYLDNAAAAVTAYPLTISARIKLGNTTFASNEERVAVCIGKITGLEEWWISYWENGGIKYMRGVVQGAGNNAYLRSSAVTLDTNYHSLLFVFGGTNVGTDLQLYRDGTLDTNFATGSSGITPASLSDTIIGTVRHSSGSFYGQWIGDIANVRISNVARDASWAKAEYNNLNSPSTFYTIT